MQQRGLRPEIVVGLFGVVAFLVIVYMSKEVNDAPFVKSKGSLMYSYFDSVSGLIPKTPVEVAGITVGFVEAIELENNRARVTLRIDPAVPIYEDAMVTIRSRGMLGDKFIAVNPGTVGKRQLGAGDAISSGRSQGEIGAMMDMMAQAAQNVNQLAKTLNDFVQSQRDQGNLDAIVENLADLSRNLNTFVSGNTNTLERVLQNMEGITAELRRTVGDGFNEKIAKSIENLEKTMASVQRIAEDVEQGKGTVGKLLRDEKTVDKLNTALDGVSEFTSGLNRIKTSVRYRGEFLIDSGELQNMVSLSIKPRPDKYFRFEVVDAPVGEQVITDTIVNAADGTPLSSTQTVQTTDNVLLSIELARRFYDATIRFGIIRNEGGLGFDYHLFDDVLTLSVEAFDFSRFENRAHVRGYATLNLYEYFLVTAGVDDILTDSSGQANPFFGFGITFDEDDIKTLLGATSLSSIGR